MKHRLLRLARAAALIALCASTTSIMAEEAKPIRIGFVTFLSGPAAGPFGVPAKLAAEAIVASINAGKAPAPHNTKGFGGAPVELVVIDEAGGATKQVSEYRNLVERSDVDFVIGYISSGDCLAVAPVAEEMKKLTVLFDCGTPRIFEEASYKYVFRTRPHATMDAVGAALYLTEQQKNIKTFAGINQNYAWGQDSWNDFTAKRCIVPLLPRTPRLSRKARFTCFKAIRPKRGQSSKARAWSPKNCSAKRPETLPDTLSTA